jgi:SulP family sulfate permease
MSEVTQVKAVRDIVAYEEGDEIGDGRPDLPPEVEVFEINGSFCFGAARKFSETLFARGTRPKVVILRMRHVLAMDATGLHALEEVAKSLRNHGATLLLSGVHAQPLVALERSGALGRIGEERMFATFAEAVVCARDLMQPGATRATACRS